MKKRVVNLLLAILTIVSLALPVYAVSTGGTETHRGSIYWNGVAVSGLEYEFINNVCYVTVGSFLSVVDPEAMVEEENGTVTVSAATVTNVTDGAGSGEAGVESETLTLTASAGISYVVANGRYLYVSGGVRLVKGSIAVPVRVLAKAFNLTVNYEAATKSVLLGEQEGASAYLIPGYAFYNNDTLYWLAHIIHAESGNQLLEGMIGVANVVMNRVAHRSFPNTIYGVLFQRNQFTPAYSGSIYRAPNERSYIAAKLAMDGANTVSGALFFNRAGMSSYAARTKTYITTIGGHAFYG